MKPRRKFSGVVLMHIYQRPVSRGLIFYSVKDFLVFYTLSSASMQKNTKYGFSDYASCLTTSMC